MKYILGFLLIICATLLVSCGNGKKQNVVVQTLTPQLLKQADKNMLEEPATITCFIAERSAGGIHDFFSEGDYWWPDPQNPDGPYIRRDGETNPDNFVAHRHAMIRFSSIVGNLTSAYLLTGKKEYAKHAMKHVRAWLMDEDTRMNPNLLYAQAIHGIATGRGIGIIDTIHLIEVAQSLLKLEKAGALTPEEIKGTKAWFSNYLDWISTHPYGIDEMNATNNHGACWVMQAAMFAKYVNNKEVLAMCTNRYKEVLLPNQMAEDGSFPRETSRTKPYGYSLFNLDAMATICKILSDKDENLWKYTTDTGKNMAKGVDFLYRYVNDKDSWPYPHDVMYWDEWPVAHPFLLFFSEHTNDDRYLNTWVKLEHFPTNEEVIRNLPIRNPVIWIEYGKR